MPLLEALYPIYKGLIVFFKMYYLYVRMYVKTASLLSKAIYFFSIPRTSFNLIYYGSLQNGIQNFENRSIFLFTFESTYSNTMYLYVIIVLHLDSKATKFY